MALDVSSLPAGHIPTAAELQTYADGINSFQYARKTGDESLASNTTMQNDDHLVVPVVANAVYEVQAFIVYTSGTTGKIKIGWTGPTSATFDWCSNGLEQNVTAASAEKVWRAYNAIGDIQTLGTAGTVVKVTAMPIGLLETFGTAGNLQFRWAQNTSDVTATIVRTNSFLRVKRLD